MQSVPELIERFGGPTAFSRVIEKGPSTASEMKRNRSIPVEYWPRVISAATNRGIEGVTADTLMAMHAPRIAVRPMESEHGPPHSRSKSARYRERRNGNSSEA